MPASKRTSREAKKPNASATSSKRFGPAGTAGKGEGDAAVAAWIKEVSPMHQATVKRIDALIEQEVPAVRRAVKWSMAMYGTPGRGFFAHVAAYKGYVALGFYDGALLRPPPLVGEGKSMRRVNIKTVADLDESQVRDWIRQASALQGWGNA